MAHTIVMIHGMWGGPWCWDNYRSCLESKGHTCLVPALRYHDVPPGSPPDPGLGTTRLLDYVNDLAAVCRGLDPPPVLIGHSMGGLLAQLLTGHIAARAVVLLTPAAPAGVNSMTLSTMKCFRSALSRWGFWKRPHLPTFDECVYAMWHLLPAHEQERAYSRLVHESGRASAEIGFWMFDPRHTTRVDAARVSCPMLVIGAGEDRITPVQVVRKIAAKYRHVSQYREFANHAHWIAAEPGWETPLQYILSWLTDLPGDKTPTQASRIPCPNDSDR